MMELVNVMAEVANLIRGWEDEQAQANYNPVLWKLKWRIT
jgi:hypothetical protein